MSAAQQETPADAWGQPISGERQAELAAALVAWDASTADHDTRRGPFDEVFLTGADAAWLADHVGRVASVNVPDRHLEGALFRDAHMEGAVLNGAHMEGAVLFEAHLEGAQLFGTHLEGARIDGARLQNADLTVAHLEKASLNFAHLEGAALTSAHLEGTQLSYAHLEGATFIDASFDKASKLNGAVFTGALLDQATFDATNLSVVSWRAVPLLGDELRARAEKDAQGKSKTPDTRRHEYRAAVRANRRLAVALQANGLSEDAVRYTYRAQICQRKASFYERHILTWLGSWVLAAAAGYGYRLWRILVAYGVVLLAFTLIYWHLGVHSYPKEPGLRAFWDSFLVSLSAIHGRTVFEQLGAWSTTAWVAAVESVFGIVVEGIFVAMLIQRFFNAR